VLAMSGSDMKTTLQLDDLGQSRRLESITRNQRSSETHRLSIDDLWVTSPLAAMKIGWQEESL
jgi:hypothetical protein